MWRDEKGSSALEFAILGPAFLMLVLGVIGLGWAIHSVSSVNYVAERVGRMLLLNPSMSEATVTAAIIQQLSYLDPASLTISLRKETSGGVVIGHANVQYDFVFEVPLAGTYPVSFSTTVAVPLG